MWPSRRDCIRALGTFAGAATITCPAGGLASTGGLTIAVQDNPPLLDPLRLTTNVAFRVAENVYDALVRIDHATGRLSPALATAWRQTSPTAWEIDLRSGVRFHDGTEMTAEDVAFSFGPQRMRTAGLPSQGISRQFFSTISAVEPVSRYTLRIALTMPDPLLEHRLAGWGAQIICKAAFERSGDWDRWGLMPIATGPYRVETVRTGEFIRLVAHDDYWGGRPPYRSLTFRVLPEGAARLSALAAGDVHIMTEVAPDQIAGIRSVPGLDVVGGAVNNVRVLNFGTLGGPLADVRLRRALSLAIDRELLVQALLGGLVQVPVGYQWPAYGDMFVADFPRPRHDPVLARQLLQQIGYAGQPIEYRVMPAYYTAELSTAQALQQMWADVGLNVNLRLVENWQNVFSQPNNAIFNGSINMVYPDAMGSLFLLYGRHGFIRTQARSWKNDRFDAICDALLQTTASAERLALHREILQIFAEDDPPGMILHEAGMFYGVRKDSGWKPQRSPAMNFGPFNPGLRNILVR